MTKAASLPRRIAPASLFARLLIALFVTVLMAQTVTFALVVAMPTPEQPITRIETIAAALRNGRSDIDGLRVTIGARPYDNLIDSRERLYTRRLAAMLGVSVAQVRLVQLRAQGSGPPDRAGRDRPVERNLPLPRELTPDPQFIDLAGESDEISGSFEAGLELADGQWRLASFEGGWISGWQWQILLWLLGSIIVVAPLAWIFARRIADPIASFANAARRIGANPTAAPLPVRGPPEIAEATTAVNEMQNRILRFVEDRTMMMGAIAHDLRTPLMRLSLRLQKAPADIREASLRDIEEIEEMTSTTLSFVRDLATSANLHRIALRPLLETVADDFADRGADVVMLPGAQVTVSGDLAAIRRMMNNLVGNAVAYADGARIGLEQMGCTARITVMDDGPGIPASEIDRVFDPFYRIEKSRNRNTGGTGLGLASARAIARSHGGDVMLVNRGEGGVLATVDLPL